MNASKSNMTQKIRDRRNPTIFEVFELNPLLSVDPDVNAKVIKDLKRPSRHYLFGPFRIFVNIIFVFLKVIKRVFPFLGSTKLLGVLSTFYAKRFMSPEALEYLLLHFQYEANIINFIAKNCGADDVLTVDSVPLCADDLNHMDDVNTIIQHDLNVYNLILDLGLSKSADVKTKIEKKQLDFSMLEIQPMDLSPNKKRILNIDIDTTMYVIGLFIGLLMNDRQITLAVNSLQLDDVLLESLANLTGDDKFLRWSSVPFTNWRADYSDPPRILRYHMYAMEYAHAHLLEINAKR